MPSQTVNSASLHSATVSLRTANLDDISKLEQVVHLAYRGGLASVTWKNEDYLVKGPRITALQLEALISSASETILVAEIIKAGQPEMAGCVLAEKHDNEVHIGMLAVNPDCQNLGLGRLLVQGAEEHARNHFGCKIAKMFVLSERAELLGWYGRLGYLETGETKPFPGPESGVKPVRDAAHFVIISKKI